MAMPRKEMLACVSKAVEAARENQRSEQELVAQQSSARWTAVAGGAAGLGFIVSLVGIALVWTTFRETRRSNIIAREMGEAQIRCYINITGAGIQFLGPDRILIGTDIKNGGQSPARNVRINARAKIVGGAIEKVISGIPAMQNSHPICVGDTMHPNALYVIDPAFTAEEITYLQANPYTIELVIAASCIDVFNVEVGTIASFNNPASFLRGDLTASELVPLARSAEKSEWQEQQTELSEKTTPPPLS